MKTKQLLLGLGILAALLVSTIGVVPGALADIPEHAMVVSGISSITKQCQYVAATPEVKDELGVPKPSTLPPTCQKNPDGTDKSCALARNTNPQPLYPPCAGVLSAIDISGPAGCVDPISNQSDCGIDTPTWYYGYCGQTYGGATGGSFRIDGKTYTIDRMGFTRGRGAWEFAGRIHLASGGPSIPIRMHLAAAPNQPNQLAGCDVTLNISSVAFVGTLELNPATNVKTFRTSPGWHWCDDDFGPTAETRTVAPFKAGSPNENC